MCAACGECYFLLQCSLCCHFLLQCSLCCLRRHPPAAHYHALPQWLCLARQDCVGERRAEVGTQTALGLFLCFLFHCFRLNLYSKLQRKAIHVHPLRDSKDSKALPRRVRLMFLKLCNSHNLCRSETKIMWKSWVLKCETHTLSRAGSAGSLPAPVSSPSVNSLRS